jgi:hypothetical protein
VAGSTRSAPHGVFFRRGRVHVRCGLQLRFSSPVMELLARPAFQRYLFGGLLHELLLQESPPSGDHKVPLKCGPRTHLAVNRSLRPVQKCRSEFAECR